MSSHQFNLNSHNECEITFRISLQPFIDLLAEKLKPVIKETKQDQLLNSKEAASFLRISVSSLWRWIKIGKLKYIKNGGRYLFKQSSLEELNVEVRMKGIRY